MKRIFPRSFAAPLTLLSVAALLTAPLSAAIVQSSGPSPTTVDLTGEGSLDWAKYSYDAGVTVTQKTSALGLGSLTLLGNNGSPVSNTNANIFSWTDGDVPSTGTGVGGGVAIATWGGNIWSLTADADTQQRRLVLYLSRNFGEITVNASLSDDVGNPSVYNYSTTGYTLQFDRHIIEYDAASPGQTLTVTVSGINPPQWVTPIAGISAATLAVIPEPASLVLMGLGSLALLGRRRRA